METEKLNVTFPEGKSKAELIIREVKNVVEKELPVLEPLNVSICGNITEPLAFLEKRWLASDNQIDHCRTHLLVDRDHLGMTLLINENDSRSQMKVIGSIALSRQYIAFGINSGKAWTPEALGTFFRINRTYFESKTDNMSLVNTLKSFKAKISTAVERLQKDNGSTTDCYRQAVDSNLPEKFFINIPIFKGTKAEKIEVNVIATVNGRDVELELISADAAAIEEDVRDRLIDEQLEEIKKLAPEIPIIEV